MVKKKLNFIFILSIENIKTNQAMQEKKQRKNIEAWQVVIFLKYDYFWIL